MQVATLEREEAAQEQATGATEAQSSSLFFSANSQARDVSGGLKMPPAGSVNSYQQKGEVQHHQQLQPEHLADGAGPVRLPGASGPGPPSVSPEYVASGVDTV